MPGGRLDYGEEPDASFIREVQEETGVIIKPLLPFYTWSWFVDNTQLNARVQIIGVARLAIHASGEINNSGKEEGETSLSKPFWIKLNELQIEGFVVDEQPALRKFFEYLTRNPFLG